MENEYAGPLLPKLQSLDNGYQNLGERLHEAGKLAGLSAYGGDNYKRPISGSSRAEWVVRWLSRKLASDASVRRLPISWLLLAELVQAIPSSKVAPILKEKEYSILSTLRSTLTEIVPIEDGPRKAEVSGLLASRKRKRGENQSINTQSQPVELYNALATFLWTMEKCSVQADPKADSTPQELMKSVLQTDAFHAAGLLKSWIDLLGYLFDICQTSENLDLRPILQIWNGRAIEPADDLGLSATTFSSECLVSAIRLLQKLNSAKSAGRVGTKNIQEALIQRLLYTHIFYPARRSFISSTSSGSGNTVQSNRLYHLFTPLREHFALIDASSMNGIAKTHPALLKISIPERSQATPKQKYDDGQWTEQVFKVLTACMDIRTGPSMDSPQGFEDTDGDLIENMLKVVQERHISLSSEFLASLAWKYCGLSHTSSPQWHLIVKILELCPGVFLKLGEKRSGLSCSESEGDLPNALIAAISRFQLYDSTTDGCFPILSRPSQNLCACKSHMCIHCACSDKDPNFDGNNKLHGYGNNAQRNYLARLYKEEIFSQRVLVTLVQAYASSNNLPNFIDLWFGELIKFYSKSWDHSMWASATVCNAVSKVLEASSTTEQVLNYLSNYGGQIIGWLEAWQAVKERSENKDHLPLPTDGEWAQILNSVRGNETAETSTLNILFADQLYPDGFPSSLETHISSESLLSSEPSTGKCFKDERDDWYKKEREWRENAPRQILEAMISGKPPHTTWENKQKPSIYDRIFPCGVHFACLIITRSIIRGVTRAETLRMAKRYIQSLLQYLPQSPLLYAFFESGWNFLTSFKEEGIPRSGNKYLGSLVWGLLIDAIEFESKLERPFKCLEFVRPCLRVAELMTVETMDQNCVVKSQLSENDWGQFYSVQAYPVILWYIQIWMESSRESGTDLRKRFGRMLDRTLVLLCSIDTTTLLFQLHHNVPFVSHLLRFTKPLLLSSFRDRHILHLHDIASRSAMHGSYRCAGLFSDAILDFVVRCDNRRLLYEYSHSAVSVMLSRRGEDENLDDRVLINLLRHVYEHVLKLPPQDKTQEFRIRFGDMVSRSPDALKSYYSKSPKDNVRSIMSIVRMTIRLYWEASWLNSDKLWHLTDIFNGAEVGNHLDTDILLLLEDSLMTMLQEASSIDRGKYESYFASMSKEKLGPYSTKPLGTINEFGLLVLLKSLRSSSLLPWESLQTQSSMLRDRSMMGLLRLSKMSTEELTRPSNDYLELWLTLRLLNEDMFKSFPENVQQVLEIFNEIMPTNCALQPATTELTGEDDADGRFFGYSTLQVGSPASQPNQPGQVFHQAENTEYAQPSPLSCLASAFEGVVKYIEWRALIGTAAKLLSSDVSPRDYGIVKHAVEKALRSNPRVVLLLLAAADQLSSEPHPSDDEEISGEVEGTQVGSLQTDLDSLLLSKNWDTAYLPGMLVLRALAIKLLHAPSSSCTIPRQLKTILPRLCEEIQSSKDIRVFNSNTTVITTILRSQHFLTSQFGLEKLLSALNILTSYCSPALPYSHAPEIFTRICKTIEVFILLHRKRTVGRMHLFLPILQNILLCIFTPHAHKPRLSKSLPSWLLPSPSTCYTLHYDMLPSKPAPITRNPLTKLHAELFTRNLITLTQPSASSSEQFSSGLNGPSESQSAVAVDEARRERDRLKPFVGNVVSTYCGLKLDGYMDPEMEKEVKRGIWACLDLMGKREIRVMIARLWGPTREVFRSVLEEWERMGGIRP